METVKISKKESNKRLKLLARFLAKLSPERFDALERHLLKESCAVQAKWENKLIWTTGLMR